MAALNLKDGAKVRGLLRTASRLVFEAYELLGKSDDSQDTESCDELWDAVTKLDSIDDDMSDYPLEPHK